MGPRWLLVLCVVAAASQAAYAALRVLITYRALDLGLGVVALGALAATIALTPVVVAVPIGRLVDRGAARTTIRWSMALTMLGGGIVASSASVVPLVIGSVTLSVAHACGVVAGQGYASIASDRPDLDKHFAAWSLSTNMGQIIGLALVGLTFELLDAETRGVAISVAAVAVLALAAVSWPAAATLPQMVAVHQREGDRAIPLRELLGVRGMKTAMFASMVILAGLDLLVVYLPVLADQHGISVQMVSVLLACRIGASMVARIALPHVLALVRRRAILISSTLCSGLSMMTLPWAVQSVEILAFCLVIIGVFWGFGQPMSMTWVVSLVPVSGQGVALAARTLANNLAQAVLPLGAGLLAGRLGVAMVFLLAGGVSVAASAGTARQP